MEHTYSKERFVVDLKFRFTWVCPVFSFLRSGNPKSDANSQSNLTSPEPRSTQGVPPPEESYVPGLSNREEMA